MPINWTLNHDELTNDQNDDSGDIGTTVGTGWMYLTPVFREGERALAPDYSPRPAAFTIRQFKGFVDTDGRLKNKPGGTAGMKAWANDPVFNLERLTYRVTADLYAPIGRPLPWEPFLLEAPSTAVTMDLTEFMPVPGALAQGLAQGPRAHTPWFVPVPDTDPQEYQAYDPDGPVGDPFVFEAYVVDLIDGGTAASAGAGSIDGGGA